MSCPVGGHVVVPPERGPDGQCSAGNRGGPRKRLWDGAPQIGDGSRWSGGGMVGRRSRGPFAAGFRAYRVQLVDPGPVPVPTAGRGPGASPMATPGGGREDELRSGVHGPQRHRGGLTRSLELLRAKADRWVALSWYGDRRSAFPLGGGFHSRRLTDRQQGRSGRPIRPAPGPKPTQPPALATGTARNPGLRTAHDHRRVAVPSLPGRAGTRLHGTVSFPAPLPRQRLPLGSPACSASPSGPIMIRAQLPRARSFGPGARQLNGGRTFVVDGTFRPAGAGRRQHRRGHRPAGRGQLTRILEEELS